MVMRSWKAGISAAVIAACALAFAAPALAADHGGGGGGGENGAPPVNTNLHPDAVILNNKNKLAVHAGPGKPNVGTVYLPPSLSGKDKKAKSGQTEEKVMGGAPAH
jgi:hypothetical protein